MRREIFSAIAFISLVSTEADACSIDPSAGEPQRPAQAVIDAVARSLFREAIYIAEVEVVSRPNGPSDPGQLRLLATIKGNAPELIIVPLPDPCRFNFATIGDREFVSYGKGDSQPEPVQDDIIESIRRQRLAEAAENGRQDH